MRLPVHLSGISSSSNIAIIAARLAPVTTHPCYRSDACGSVEPE